MGVFCIINSAVATAAWPSTTATGTTYCYASTVTAANCATTDDAATAGSKCCLIVFAASTDPHLSTATTTGPASANIMCFKLGGNLKLTYSSNAYEVGGNQFCKTAHTAAVTGVIQYSAAAASA